MKILITLNELNNNNNEKRIIVFYFPLFHKSNYKNIYIIFVLF